MKFLLLIFLCTAISLPLAHAQGNEWFKGTWYGERTFPHSRVAAKALMRMEVDTVKGNVFTGRLIYMYPSDTSARLIKNIGGVLYGKSVTVVIKEEIYRADPRSRSFWSDCSPCSSASSFYIENGNLVLQIITAACSNNCDGETIFSRTMQDYNADTQVAIVKEFGADRSPAFYTSYTTTSIDTAGKPSANGKTALKFFPHLLNDSMHVNFDPNKYKTLKPITTDTASMPKQATASDKIIKKAVSTKNAVVKDSTALNNKSGNSIAANKTIVQDSAINKTGQNNNLSTATTASKVPANGPNTNPATTSNGNATALPTPVKDTVPAAITQRTTSLVNTYQVDAPNIAVQLLDDGQIDGDAVSVYYNGKLVINNQTLTHKAVTFNIEASAANRHHEFILISESEGFLPPNTALMRIKAGSQQFELTVSSSSARNAKIAIDYRGE